MEMIKKHRFAAYLKNLLRNLILNILIYMPIQVIQIILNASTSLKHNHQIGNIAQHQLP